MEVTEDRGKHSNMSFEKMEEYRELLRQLELTSEEENDNYSEDTS